MIYTVECAFTDPAQEAAWNAYYDGEKLDSLLSVPGFRASQRFHAVMNTPAPYFAVHSLRDERVLGDTYKGVGGGAFGGWDGLVTNWRRNLFTGMDMAPEVPDGSCLVVLDEPGAAAAFPALEFTWLDCVGLDRSVERRALAIADRARIDALDGEAGSPLRVFAPITTRRVSPHEAAG